MSRAKAWSGMQSSRKPSPLALAFLIAVSILLQLFKADAGGAKNGISHDSMQQG